MRVKTRTLALMVAVACGGLSYGIYANATAIADANSQNALLGKLKSYVGNGINNSNMQLDSVVITDDEIPNIITSTKPPVVTDKVYNAEQLKTDVDAAKTAINVWTTEFKDILDTDNINQTDGLLKELYEDLKMTNPTFKKLDGSAGVPRTAVDNDSNDNLDTVNAIIFELVKKGREAKALDAEEAAKGNTGTNYAQFLLNYKDDLKVLGVTDDSGNRTDGTATKTFEALIALTPYSEMKATFEHVNNMNTTLGKATSGIKAGKLGNNQTDDNGVIVATKGTNTKVKDGSISYKGNDLGADKHSYAYLEKEDKSGYTLFELGKVNITDSNVQGSGNTVVAKSEAVFKNKELVNPAVGITAFGNRNTIESNGIAIGNDNTVGENSTVIGNKSTATGDNAIAFGNNAIAEHKNSIALGSDSKTTRENEINVGIWKLTKGADEKDTLTQTGRNISGVADATRNDDAVNLKQLNEVKDASALDATTKAAQAVETSNQYTNEQIKTAGTSAKSYTDKQVSGLKQEMNSKIDALDKKVNKGFAANAALSGLFQPYGVGKINMTAGIGGYKDESAVAVGIGYRVNENVAIKGGVATAVGNGSSTMYNASVNFEW